MFSYVIADKPQLGQHCRDLQRLRDRDGSLWTNVVVPELELGQDRVDLQRLRDVRLLAPSGPMLLTPRTRVVTTALWR